MSSEPSDPQSDSICSKPLSLVANSDMDGIAVAVANVIVNLCFRIMVTWSPEDVDVGVQSLLVQIYTILLSTLLSINRQQLSKFDAGFALLVSSSPLTVYIVVASISDLCGINTGLYKRIKSHRHIVRALGASVLLLWTGLSMTVNLSSRAFKDSSCGVSTFPEWLRDTARSLWISLWAPGVVGQFGNALLSIMWMICWVRRRSRLTMYAKLSSGEASKLRQLWMLLKCPWLTIDRHHKWCIYCLFAYLDVGWGYQIISSAVSASEGGYVLSYGQISSLLVVVPILVSTVNFVYSRRLNLFHLLRRLPRACLVEMWYLLTGKVLDPVVQDGRLPSNITPGPETLALGRRATT